MDWLIELLKDLDLMALSKASFWLVFGLLIASLLKAVVNRWVSRHASQHQTLLMSRLIYYLTLIIFTISAFDQLGFQMSTLIGVAGVFTVAIGLASQTAASNVISGLFMIGEKSFQVGDRIEVDGTVGDVLSMDLLSVKLRKLDNTMVRLPNEVLLKTMIINHTCFPIRRYDLVLRIGFKENLEKIQQILLDAAKHHPDCLETPAPELIFLEYTETGFKVQFSSWTTQKEFLNYKTAFALLISRTLQEKSVIVPHMFDLEMLGK